VTRYELFRKRIAPALFLALLGLIALDAWRKDHNAGITGQVILELGEAEPRVRQVEAELLVRDESISTFRRTAAPGGRIGPCRFEAHMPASDGVLRLTVDLDGTRREMTRAVHIEDGAIVRVELGSDLARDRPQDPAPPR
jgi:hypothetical protein